MALAHPQGALLLPCPGQVCVDGVWTGSRFWERFMLSAQPDGQSPPGPSTTAAQPTSVRRGCQKGSGGNATDPTTLLSNIQGFHNGGAAEIMLCVPQARFPSRSHC